MSTPVKFDLARALQENEYPTLGVGYGYNVKGDLIDPCFGEMVCKAPTIAEVVMWFYNTHRIWVGVSDVDDSTIFRHTFSNEDFYTPEEAYEAAFEYLLNNKHLYENTKPQG